MSHCHTGVFLRSVSNSSPGGHRECSAMRCRQRGWKCLVLLAVATPMANGKNSECKGNQILEMIEDYAPQCIEACEEVCQPLGGLIMSVFAGEMDAATLICPDWQTFSCMAKTPLILSHCTPLLPESDIVRRFLFHIPSYYSRKLALPSC